MSKFAPEGAAGFKILDGPIITADTVRKKIDAMIKKASTDERRAELEALKRPPQINALVRKLRLRQMAGQADAVEDL